MCIAFIHKYVHKFTQMCIAFIHKYVHKFTQMCIASLHKHLTPKLVTYVTITTHSYQPIHSYFDIREVSVTLRYRQGYITGYQL